MYAIAYGVLMDPKRSATVVEQTFAECGRTAGQGTREGETLHDRLAATARRLSGEHAARSIKETEGTEVPVPTKVVHERWLAASPAGAWSLLI